MQREIEAAGIATINLSSIPDLTSAVCVPRLAGIEHPFGRNMGQPKDANTQLAVLRQTLEAAESIKKPGGVVHLPFEWPESPREVRKEKNVSPPISRLLARNPRLLPRFFKRDVPPSEKD